MLRKRDAPTQRTREAIFQACDNLAKNTEFKALLLGNAESREDPHGRFSEPLGGWLSVDPDTSEIFHQCVELCRSLHIPPARFALGSSGEGGGLLSIFRREWGPVVGIEEAGRVSERPVSAVNPRPASEEYDRVVSELHFAVQEFAQVQPR